MTVSGIVGPATHCNLLVECWKAFVSMSWYISLLKYVLRGTGAALTLVELDQTCFLRKNIYLVVLK